MTHTYEIKKICRTWYVYRDGVLDSGYTTKKVAKKCVEIRKIEDNGESFTPLHPRWTELMASF